MSVVEYAVADRVARITLNRPERGNGITRALIAELELRVERADLDPTVHVILLAGNGKGFCGGYDQGLQASQTLGTLLDGAARHTPEGYAFQSQAAREGVRAAVHARDDPFGDAGASTYKG